MRMKSRLIKNSAMGEDDYPGRRDEVRDHYYFEGRLNHEVLQD